jgi:hypothetical protein
VSSSSGGLANPFNITKANDLTDAQIEALWVDVRNEDADTALFAAARPASPMPMFILGGKGSGKTHLLRYCSYATQKIRYGSEGITLLAGVARDRYIGVYVRCSGLNSGRFAKKRQDDEIWREVFAYYVELWLAQQALGVSIELVAEADLGDAGERKLCTAISDLFDKPRPQLGTLVDMLSHVRDLQRELDYLVNNATFTGQLPVDVQATRGRLIFGIPAALIAAIPVLAGISFVYQLDEFENLTADQQRHVNTLVREREPPATFKIGGRQFGVKTQATFSDGEVNLRDSEFEELRLDEQFRSNARVYKELARKLAARRLSQAVGASEASEHDDLASLAAWFEQPDLGWRSAYFQELSPQPEPRDRAHFVKLQEQLDDALRDDLAPGIRSQGAIREVCAILAVPTHPLLEKVNLLYFYQDWSRSRQLPEAATAIARRCAAFLAAPEANSAYGTKLGHFKADLAAQMVRENRPRQLYAGIDTFVRMSEGLPRAFITLLKQTYDWSVLQREQPFINGRISLEAQRRGAVSAAEWFYNSMTKAGEDGPKILSAVDRLGQLFRLHRFADKPIESSLIGFSAKESDANEEARHVLSVARSRSFMVDVFGGQRDRNSSDPTTKLQLNRMLAPRWDLPTSRRGIVPFSAQEVNAIFCPGLATEFEAMKREWGVRLNAPFRLRGGAAGQSIGDDGASSHQPNLF